MITLVTFHKMAAEDEPSGVAGESAMSSFLKTTGEFQVTTATPGSRMVHTFWWMDGINLRHYTEERTGVSLFASMFQFASSLGMDFASWYSPHAFSTLMRMLHWDCLNEGIEASVRNWVTAGGVTDIVDLFYTAPSMRSTLTRDERVAASAVAMRYTLPNLCKEDSSGKPSDMALFLLRLCHRHAGVLINF